MIFLYALNVVVGVCILISLGAKLFYWVKDKRAEPVEDKWFVRIVPCRPSDDTGKRHHSVWTQICNRSWSHRHDSAGYCVIDFKGVDLKDANFNDEWQTTLKAARQRCEILNAGVSYDGASLCASCEMTFQGSGYLCPECQ